MLPEQMNSLDDRIQREIRGKLAVLAAMTPASRADWFMAIPLCVMLSYDPKGIFSWAASSLNIEIEWDIEERRGRYAPRY